MGFAAVLTVISVCVTSSFALVDRTTVPETSGSVVVESVVSRIRLSGIFPDDHSFLRRLAFVESLDGKHEDTYYPNYGGGIWQVDRIGFEGTQDVSSHPALVKKHQKIKEAFNIDWPNVQWMDLRKPLYSGIAARLFLSNIAQKIPLASNITGQAHYWKTHYNTEIGNGTIERFIEDVDILEKSQG